MPGLQGKWGLWVFSCTIVLLALVGFAFFESPDMNECMIEQLEVDLYDIIESTVVRVSLSVVLDTAYPGDVRSP